MKTTIFLTVTLTLLLCNARAQMTYTLSGFVSDSLAKEKIDNAQVWLKPTGPDAADSLAQWNAVTDNKGNFIFFNIIYGEYILNVSHPGYIPAAKKILVSKDDKLSIVLLKANTGNALLPIKKDQDTQFETIY